MCPTCCARDAHFWAHISASNSLEPETEDVVSQPTSPPASAGTDPAELTPSRHAVPQGPALQVVSPASGAEDALRPALIYTLRNPAWPSVGSWHLVMR